MTLNEAVVPLHFSYLSVNGTGKVCGLNNQVWRCYVELRGTTALMSVERSVGPVCCKGSGTFRLNSLLPVAASPQPLMCETAVSEVLPWPSRTHTV